MVIGCPHIQELALLRDALYLLQGISGKHVRFATGKDGETEMSLLFMEDTVGLIVQHCLAIDHPF
jgi:gamma-tubulin complex component 3